MNNAYIHIWSTFGSFSIKIKLFRANLRGVSDKKFFLFRIDNLYAYPH